MSESSESELSNRSDSDVSEIIINTNKLQEQIEKGINSYTPNPWFWQDKKLGQRRKQTLINKLKEISNEADKRNSLITILVSLFEPQIGLKERKDDNNIPAKADHLLSRIAQKLLQEDMQTARSSRNSANICPASYFTVNYNSDVFSDDIIKTATSTNKLTHGKNHIAQLDKKETITWFTQQAFEKLSPNSQKIVKEQAEALRLSFNPNFQPSNVLKP